MPDQSLRDRGAQLRTGTGGPQFDQLRLNAGAALGGTLNVTRINGFNPAASDAFAAINRDVAELSGAIQTIANSAASQAENLSQINLSVSDLDRSTQQNAAMAEQCTAAATSLSQEANTLNGALSQFDVGMDSPAKASSPLLARAA